MITPNTSSYSHTPKQYGKNGEIEYGWSNNIKEWIPQFYFQLTRTNETKIELLENKLRDNLYYLVSYIRVINKQNSNQNNKQNNKQNSNQNNNQNNNQNIDINIQIKEEYIHYIILLYKMIGNTRDIINGKGERTLTYMMIIVWYDFFPELAFYALHSLVHSPTSNNSHPYGSWKDMKYFCQYLRLKTMNEEHPLIQECIKIINSQLLIDSLLKTNDNISLVSKWIPREKSKKFGWLFHYLAYNYFKHYIESANSLSSLINSKLKCKTHYRMLISKLNKKLDTLEIKQCSKEWSTIDFDNVTSISLNINQKCFLNYKEIDDKDRIKCEENFKKYIENCKLNSNLNKTTIKGNKIGLNEFTKTALNIIKEKKKNNNIYTEKLLLEKELLNLQWNHHSFDTDNLGNMVPMIDLSSSMSGEPFNTAIALGIRVAEKSRLSKRIMIIGNYPIWINLESKDNFVDYVEEIISYQFDFELNSNIYSAFDLLLDALIKSKIELEYANNISVIIFSDIQFDGIDSKFNTSVYEKIKERYTNIGLATCNKSFNIPHIIFWNLSSTNGFPNLSYQPNVSMLSGFHSSLLNLFSKKGVKVLCNCNPISRIEQILMNKRYDNLEIKAISILHSI